MYMTTEVREKRREKKIKKETREKKKKTKRETDGILNGAGAQEMVFSLTEGSAWR